MQSLSVADAPSLRSPPSPPSPAKSIKRTPAVTAESSAMASLPVLVDQEAELYLWDAPNEDFINQGIVAARILQQNRYEYWLTASSEQGTLLAHKITSDMNQRWSHKMLSLTWNHLGDDGSQNSWLFRFSDAAEFAAVLQTFTQCLWESLHEIQWGKAKVLFKLHA